MAREHRKGYVPSIETRKKISEAKSLNFQCSCDYCGELFTTKPSAYARKKRHFCSQSCYSLFRSELLPVEEHPRYGKGHSMPERQKRLLARSTFNHALNSGKVGGPFPCEVCLTTHDIEAHHPDYAKPLEVQWLCRKHHRLLHRRIYENPDLLK